MATSKAKPRAKPSEGPAHADSHLLRVERPAWELLSTIAAASKRTRKASFTVIMEEYADIHPELVNGARR